MMLFAAKPVSTLQKMLSNAGFNDKNLDYILACQIFKEFSFQKVKCNDDALLFQYGCDYEEKYFYWDLVRQFSFNKFGEYDHMEQLHFECIFEPTPELKMIKSENLWSYDCSSFDDFFKRIEEMEGFKKPWEQNKPYKINVFQEKV